MYVGMYLEMQPRSLQIGSKPYLMFARPLASPITSPYSMSNPSRRTKKKYLYEQRIAEEIKNNGIKLEEDIELSAATPLFFKL